MVANPPRAQLEEIVEEMLELERAWRVLAKENRIDAKHEPNPQLGQVAAAIHEACADDLGPLVTRLAAISVSLSGQQEKDEKCEH